MIGKNGGKNEIYINKSPIAFIVMLLGGIALTVWGTMETFENNRFKENCQQTVGTIIDYERGSNDSNGYSYYAKYEYVVDGEIYRVTADKSSKKQPIIGNTGTVYFAPDEPSYARTDIGGSLQYTTIILGFAFAVVGAVCILLRFEANEAIVQILVGIIFLAMAVLFPIATGKRIFFVVAGVLAFVGIIIIIKAIIKLAGREGGTVDRAIDEKWQVVEDAIVNTSSEVEERLQENTFFNPDTSPIVYISNIISGIVTSIVGVVFILGGGYFMFITDITGRIIGTLCVIVGIAVLIKAIRFIKQGFEIRKEQKINKY